MSNSTFRTTDTGEVSRWNPKLARWDAISPIEKAPVPALSAQNSSAMMPLSYSSVGGWLSSLMEANPGDWQKNRTACGPKDVLAFSAVYTCISLIAGDISKLRIKLVEQVDGIWREVKEEKGTAFRPVLTKPNDFQTRIQFLSQWITSKLTYGNAYILKRYDGRETVKAMYVLDPRCVEARVTDTGAIWYVIKRDPLSTVTEDIYAVPASEIIHDTMVTLWHPLIGVSPIYACGAAALQGLRIQEDSERFFMGRSNPSGILSIPSDNVTDAQMDAMKVRWDANYGPGGKGGTAVLKNGIKWEAMRMSAVDAQLIEQLRWTIEDVARCFHVPLHMLGVQGSNPSYNNIGALNQQYYAQTLQVLIESIELLLDEGLGLLDPGYGSELDLASLVRMDPAARIATGAIAVGAGIFAINEARAIEDLPPMTGGDVPLLQQQNWPLQDLANRKPPTDSLNPAPALPAPPADETPPVDDAQRELEALDFLMKELADVEYA